MGGRGAGSGVISRADRAMFGGEFHISGTGTALDGTYVVNTKGKFRGTLNRMNGSWGFRSTNTTLKDMKRLIKTHQQSGRNVKVEKLADWRGR